MSTQNSQTSPSKYFILFMALFMALAPFSIDAYLPSFPSIAAEFGVDPSRVSYTMSSYLIGLAIGQILGGPLSDQIGRKRIGLLGLTIYLAMTLLIIFAQTVDQLIVLRALQAFGGGFATCVIMPTIRDISAPEKAAGRMAMVFLIMLMAPMLAPIVGVSLLPLGWRFIFVFLFVYGGLIFLVYTFFIKETRFDRLRRPDFPAIFSQYKKVVRHRLDGQRVSIWYGLAASFSGSLMLIYITNVSFIYQTYYQVGNKLFAGLFIFVVACLAIVQSISARYLKSRSLHQTANYFRFGQRLQLCLTAVLLVVIFFDPALWVFMACIASVLACMGINGPAGAGLYLSAFKKLSGSASSLLTVGNFALGSLFGLLSGVFHTGTLVPFAVVIFCVSLAANVFLTLVSRETEQLLLGRLQNGQIEPL